MPSSSCGYLTDSNLLPESCARVQFVTAELTMLPSRFGAACVRRSSTCAAAATVATSTAGKRAVPKVIDDDGVLHGPATSRAPRAVPTTATGCARSVPAAA